MHLITYLTWTELYMVLSVIDGVYCISKYVFLSLGSVFAGVASVEIVTNLASGLGANAVYDATVGIYRGLTFFIMAGYGVFSIMLSL